MPVKVFYHTQESRRRKLTGPIICKRDDAWLGAGSYFWRDLFDATQWGINSKQATGAYEIYESEIELEDVLDTVFNEEHYFLWLRMIEKVAKTIITKTHNKPTLKELNDYLKERAAWDQVDGIQFQDLPTNNDFLLVKPIEYKGRKRPFVYKKRMQLVVFNSRIIKKFTFLQRESLH